MTTRPLGGRGTLVCLATAAAAPLAAQAPSNQPEILACYDSRTSSTGTPQGSGIVYRIKVPGVVGQQGCVDPRHTQFSWTIQHGALSGLSNDDHPRYLLADGVRASTNGFAVTGASGAGTVPVTGAGTRFMWVPGKAALRAGNVDASNSAAWDPPNVGPGSLAVGLDVTASGQGSQALGGGSVASGFYSRAFGNGATASGDYATAIGPNGTASGNSATAIGFLANAGGASSLALGERVTASGGNSTAMGFNASTNGQDGSFVYGDHTFADAVEATAPNQFVVRASGGFQFRTHNTLATGCNLPPNSGSWDCSSSVTVKTDFEPVDGEDVLARIRALPVQRWSYRGEQGVRHLGTFAEDFYRAFGLGTGATTIGMIDMDGVNLAAAQALDRRTRELRSLLEERDRDIARLRAQLMELSRRLERLEGTGR